MVVRTEREQLILERFAWQFDFCWACGIDPTRQRRADPEYPISLEIHHIAKLGRKHERWNLCRLCKLCHDLAERHTIRLRSGLVLPKLEHEHVLWLKSHRDHANYKRAELQKVWRRGKVPRCKRLPKWFTEQFAINRGRKV